MIRQADFVPKLEVIEGERREFRGTGILVAENYVLTCAHNLLNISAMQWDRQSREAVPDDVGDLRVVFSAETRGTPHAGSVVAFATPDLALIRLHRPVRQTPTRLISGIRRCHENAILERHSLLVGFSSSSPETLTASTLRRIVDSTWEPETGRLLDLQVEGGRASGMSGAPAVAFTGGQWACFGMAYLGGESASSSRLILADVILDFLRAQKIGYPTTLKADECFLSTVGMLIQKQRLARGIQLRELAASLQISENTVAEWENKGRTPALEYREYLFDSLVSGEPDIVEEWQRLLAQADGSAVPVDIVARLRPLSNLALTLEPAGRKSAYRGLGNRSEQTGPVRQRLIVGTSIRLMLHLDREAWVTVLDVEGIGSTERKYFCLDPLLGMSGMLRAGANPLPPARESPLPVVGPAGLYCVIAIARRSGPFQLTTGEAQGPQPIAQADLLTALQPLFESGDDDYFVAVCEYEVGLADTHT